MNVLSILLLLVTMMAWSKGETRTFVHPGIWFTQADLNRIRAMVQTNQNPWKETSNHLIGSASKTHGSGAAVHQTDAYALQNNANNIMKLAMAWVVTGDISFGIAAMSRLNDWSIYRSGGDCLRQGIGASNLVNAAEIIRYASVNGVTINWPAEQIAAFEDMLTNYMMTTLDTLKNGGDGGWGTPAINAIASIGVFCNNATIYDKGINLFKYGAKNVYPDATACNGVLEMIDSQGICYDSGRDQPHAQGIISHLFDVAITSWNQGTEDLFSYGNNRLLLGLEYAAKYNLGEDVPYVQQYDCHGQKKWGASISPINRGGFSPTFEKCVAYYEAVKGIPAPYSKQVADHASYYPEGNNNDHFGYGGLVYRR